MIPRSPNKVPLAGLIASLVFGLAACVTPENSKIGESHDDESVSRASSAQPAIEYEYNWYELHSSSSQHPFLQRLYGEGNGLKVIHESCDKAMSVHRERSPVTKSSIEFGFSVNSSKQGFEKGIRPYLAHRCPD